MKIFVTGATGYIGGTLAQRLVQAGHQVHGLLRSPEKAKPARANGIVPVLGTLDDSAILRKAASEADAVVNAASSDLPKDRHCFKGSKRELQGQLSV
jgi:uncharacterized protein YbjT (DUF2867 family)